MLVEEEEEEDESEDEEEGGDAPAEEVEDTLLGRAKSIIAKTGRKDTGSSKDSGAARSVR